MHKKMDAVAKVTTLNRFFVRFVVLPAQMCSVYVHFEDSFEIIL